MKTKKITRACIALSAAMLISNLLFAQGAYVGVGLGYGMSAGSQIIGVNETSTTDEGVYGSLGEGLNFGVAVGYMFSQHIGGELGFSYLMGSEFESTDNSSPLVTYTQKVKGSMIRIIPAIKVMGKEGTVTPYGKFGFVLGLGTTVSEEETRTTPGSTETNEYEYNGGSSMGWMGAFGLNFRLNDNIKFYAELNTINQTYGPDKYENISRSDGDPLDPPITLDDNVSSSSSNTSLRPLIPFGSVGINVGLTFLFGGSSSEAPAAK